MEIRRVALIYHDQPRPETTGFYCRRALESLVEVTHFRPDDLAAIPRDGFDLYLNVDDGLDYRLPQDLRPCAWWAIDTHVGFARCLDKAVGSDVVFAAQRDGTEQLRRAGVQSAAWLPLACDPDIHRKHDVSRTYDTAFVGHVFSGARSELLALIRRRFPRSFIGHAYFEEMARTYSSAHVAFNRSILNDVNMRVFEAVACGSMLLTNALADNGQDELFRDGLHLATYREPEEMLDKLAYYLKRGEIRERIAEAGRAEAVAKHTYRHRMERLLREAEAALGRLILEGIAPREADAENGAGASSLPHSGDNVDTVQRPADDPRVACSEPSTDPFYFGHARPEVVALVPVEAKRVLDIGCGAGWLGAVIKARQSAEVVGIELDKGAAAQARLRLDKVIVSDVERLTLDFPPGSFDAIVCADVLEHMREPERVLSMIRPWLASDGRLVVSVPNVRHQSVVRSLLQGNWTYEPAGLLDRTHLRFFTRRELEKLLHRAGFAVDELRWVSSPGDDPSQRRRGEVCAGRLQIVGLTEAEVDEFFAYQYLAVARPAPTAGYGITSIVIVTHNQIEYTHQCLDSIRFRTDESYELIVVDNASTDGTLEYLRAFGGVLLIANGDNRGFPAAANQGIAAATGDQILLLNNDVVVTTGWLGRLLRALYSDPAIGLAGPCSNRVSGPQQVEVGYEHLVDLDGFAWDWGKANDGVRMEIHRLVGFCLLIRRAVIDAIGLLDEQFGVGCFEDDDYTLRANRAGYRAVIAADAFIHHYGGRTFEASGLDIRALLAENHGKFLTKWSPGALEPSASPSPREPESSPERKWAIETFPGGGLRLVHARPRLSLCMIVRDSSRTLPACLETIRPWVDEMVIVDTGSVDETPRIVESYGGRLFHFPWCDDFSAARNESLRHARGEWIFWMDSDDTIPPECGRQLRGLIDHQVDPRVLGYVMQVHCPGGGELGEGDPDVTVVDHVKMFRNRPDLRFDGRIHEQILPAIRRAGGEVAWTDIYVVHSGSDPRPPAQERKRTRDMRLLRLELAERPDHPFTLFNLGMTHVHGSQFAEAADYLKRSIAQSSPEESHLRKAYALLVYAQMRLGQSREALANCRRGRELFPHDAELQFREGVLLHELGQLEEARRSYLGVLEQREERHFSSVDRGLAGFKARQNLAVVASDMGDFAEAERQWRHVVEEVPGYRPGWRGLGEALIRQGRFAEADLVVARLMSEASNRVEGLLIKSRIAVAQERFADALTVLAGAVAEFPDDAETLNRHSQLLFEHGRPADAEQALKALIDHDSEDPSAYYNLGTLYLRTERYDQAAFAYRQSLRFRTNHSPTYFNLGCALRDGGRISEAVAAWEQVLRLVPGDPSAQEELRCVFAQTNRSFVPVKTNGTS